MNCAIYPFRYDTLFSTLLFFVLDFSLTSSFVASYLPLPPLLYLFVSFSLKLFYVYYTLYLSLNFIYPMISYLENVSIALRLLPLSSSSTAAATSSYSSLSSLSRVPFPSFSLSPSSSFCKSPSLSFSESFASFLCHLSYCRV